MVIFTCGCFILSSCSDDIEPIQDNAGGNFLAINMATNDTLKIEGGTTINLGSAKGLSAKKGNIIKLKYIPKEKYKNYNFDVTFTIDENEVKIPSKYEYEFSTTGLEVKDHTIKLSANCTEENKQITARGTFYLKLSE